MFVFGDPAPRSPKWWAPWIYTAMFAALAGFLTYGASAHGARQGIHVLLWLLWLATLAMFINAVAVTIRTLSTRHDE